jgi:alpha-galactosidase
MDMLVVGMHGNGNVAMGGCTDIEYKTHFSAWAMLNSPLMIGCDIRNMSEATKKILLDRDILSINQDKGGRQPFLINTNGQSDDRSQMQIWVKHLDGGDLAIGLFNMSDYDQAPWFGFCDLGIDRSSQMALEITDLWEKKCIGVFHDLYRTFLPAHDCQMLRCKLVPARGNYTKPYC